MPYVSDSNLEENQQQTPGATAPGSQPGQVSGQPNQVSGQPAQQQQPASQSGSSSTATEAPAAPSLASGTGLTNPTPGQTGKGATGGGTASSSSGYDPNAPTSGGNWTNIQNYLTANNGGAFGQQFAGNVGNDVTSAQNAITNASNNFQNQVNQGTLQNNQNVLNEVGSAPQSMSTADQSTFENQLKGGYTGPQSAGNDTGFSNADTTAHNAYSEAQAAQTPGGQATLLQKFYNAPQYTTGQQSLDEAFLSMDPNAQAALSQLAGQAGSLPVNYENAFNAANTQAGQAQATSTQARQAANTALFGQGGSAASVQGGAIGNLQNTLNSQATTAKTAFDQAQQDIQNAVASGDYSKLTPAESQMLGYSNSQPYTYGVSAQNYLSTNPDTGITANTAATAQQAAQMDALAKLAGLQTDPYANSQVAGTAPTNPVNFNEAGFQNAVLGQQQAYQNDFSTAANPYSAHGYDNPGSNDPLAFAYNEPTAAGALQQLLANPVDPTAPAYADWAGAVQKMAGILNQINSHYGIPAVSTAITGPVRTSI